MARSQTRTIRFTDKDLQDIDQFLEQNQIFDFSTMARLAIRRFIENPSLEVRGLSATKTKKPVKKNREVEL